VRPDVIAPVPDVSGFDEPATVSVIIPCYNYARFLPQAVKSALSQDHVSVDVVVVDDASTDGSLAVAQGLARDDPRAQVVSNAHNSGPVKTFNRGLELARGEFLVRLDADDLLTEGSLSRAVAVMRSLPAVGLVYGHPLHFHGDVLPKARTNPTGWLHWQGLDWLRARCEAGNNVITSPEVLMRASVVARVGGQENLAHTHDMEMWFRIAAFSDVAYILGADQAWHRLHEKSLSMANRNIVKERIERRAAFETLFSGIAADLPEAEELLATARRALAHEALVDACHLYDRGRGDAREIGDALLLFARDCDPAVATGPLAAALARRRRLGPAVVSWLPWHVAQSAYRGIMLRVRWHRWHRSGVYEPGMRSSGHRRRTATDPRPQG
jgi:glycosyltransferase involved in cell wall biosynthesis